MDAPHSPEVSNGQNLHPGREQKDHDGRTAICWHDAANHPDHKRAVGIRFMPIAVIDFETTGSSPNQGARATEIAAVLVDGDRIVDQYQSLMYSGAWVPPFIEQLTGITNEMLADAPPAERVMNEVLGFTSGCSLVAHNAAFDRAFWIAEAQQAGLEDRAGGAFACTVRLSRRLLPQAPNHRLGTLASYCRLPDSGRAHRALADARTAAHLLIRLQQELAERLGSSVPCAIDHSLLCRVQTWPRARIGQQLEKYCAYACDPKAVRAQFVR